MEYSCHSWSAVTKHTFRPRSSSKAFPRSCRGLIIPHPENSFPPDQMSVASRYSIVISMLHAQMSYIPSFSEPRYSELRHVMLCTQDQIILHYHGGTSAQIAPSPEQLRCGTTSGNDGPTVTRIVSISSLRPTVMYPITTCMNALRPCTRLQELHPATFYLELLFNLVLGELQYKINRIHLFFYGQELKMPSNE